MMTYELGLRCAICGAPITDGNETGIGFGCRDKYDEAVYRAISKDPDNKFAYNSIKVHAYMDKFVEEFGSYDYSQSKSGFMKDFVPSVIKFYKDKGYVSGKQLEVCKNLLFQDEVWDRWHSCYSSEVPIKKRIAKEWSEFRFNYMKDRPELNQKIIKKVAASWRKEHAESKSES